MTTREPTMTITDLISALEDVRATYGDMPVLVTAPAPDAVWKELSRFGRAAAWVLGGIAVILLIIGATTALGVTR